MNTSDFIAVAALIVSAISAVVSFWYSRRASKASILQALADLQAELEQARTAYIRFNASDRRQNPDEHMRLVSEAQAVCTRAAVHGPKCPEACLAVKTDRDADRAEFDKQDIIGRDFLEYIGRKWLTVNQVKEKDNPLECTVWGEYEKRNMNALDRALEILRGTIAKHR